MREQLLHRGTDAGYAAGWAAVRAMPEPVAVALARSAADVASRRRGPGVRRLSDNLRRVLGAEVTEEELTAVTRAGVRSYARYWREVFRMPSVPRDRIVSSLVMHAEDRLRESVGSGRGTIVALPHSGNWDHAGAWCVLTGMPFTTVAERLEPASVFDRFVAFRESLGMEVVPLTGGARPPARVLDQRLRAGGFVALLGDRDLTAGGVDVSFFGSTARMPAGPAALALRTGADLLPVSIWYDDSLTHVRIHPRLAVPAGKTFAVRVAAMTQALADVYATGPDGIASHPADWHMLQRLWLADLAPDDPRRVRRAAA